MGAKVPAIVSVAILASVTARAEGLVEGLGDAKTKVWDSRTAWRLSLPVWLGERRRVRVEGAYSVPFRSGVYLPDEGWDVSLAWAF